MDTMIVRFALFLLAFVGFLGVFWSVLIGINSAGRIGVIVYSILITVVNFYIALGMLLRWDTSRVAAIILSPLPLVGAFLFLTPLVNVSLIPFFLLFTGVSLPALAVSIGVYVTNPTLVVFGIANIVIPIFLSGEDVKNFFKRATPKQTTQIKPDTTSKAKKKTRARTINHHRQT